MTLETLTTLQWWIIGALYVGGFILMMAASDSWRGTGVTEKAIMALVWPIVMLVVLPFVLALEFTKGGR